MSTTAMNDCRKAVNQAIFRPTAERKAHAIALLKAMMEAVTNLEEVKPTKTKAKAKRKATKRTPSQKVADAMDRAAMKTNEVGPVKPTSKGRKASVASARKAAQAVSEHTGAAQRAAKKAESKGNNADIASLEAKVEALTKALAIHMESALPTADFVSLDEIPFEL